MDGCQDRSHISGRLQTQDIGRRTEVAPRLFYSGYEPIPLPVVNQSLMFGWARVGEKSPETIALRKKTSDGCEKLIWDYFEAGGQVVIYDANNGTKAARQALAEKFDKSGIHVVMLGLVASCLVQIMTLIFR